MVIEEARKSGSVPMAIKSAVELDAATRIRDQHALCGWAKKWLVAVALTLSVGDMSGCTGTSDISWNEEVQTSDGRVIVVEREAIYGGGGDEWASNRGGGKIDEERIRFASPDGSGKTVEWRSTKKSPGTYPEVPLIFDLPAGKPTVFTLVAISNACDVYSKYVYQQETWVEEALPEQFRQQAPNLLFGSQRDLPELLTLAEKNKRNSGDGYRKALKQIGPNRKVCG